MSKLQDMPIMDRLHVGAKLNMPTADPSNPLVPVGVAPIPVCRSTYDWMASFKRVRLNDNDRIATPKAKTWDSSKIFGHLRLPFPRLWIEWDNVRDDGGMGVPSLWMAAVCESYGHVLEHGGSLFTHPEIMEAEIPGVPLNPPRKNSWVVTPLALTNGVPVRIPMTLIVDLSDDGVFEGVRGADGAVLSNWSGAEESAAQQTAVVVDLVWDALVAVGWMNCQNVALRRHDRSGNIGGSKRKRLRNKARSLDFHTIHLPGINYESDGSVSVDHRDDLRLHQVRGHFKTFTADAPLLGQHVGTYWWGWQVRGNKKNGVVVSDYKIGQPA